MAPTVLRIGGGITKSKNKVLFYNHHHFYKNFHYNIEINSNFSVTKELFVLLLNEYITKSCLC
jgi:hypothetical protein